MTVRVSSAAGVLYIVPTPIGNLADMVPRAIEVLQTVDLIAAEDTRHSGKLMQHFQISTPMISYHDFSSEQKAQDLLDRLKAGKNIALISDAGTPLISDPGYRLVSAAREEGINVIPIPGACAAIAALSASGLPSDRFAFEGFPPAKNSARRAFYQALVQDSRTLIFYESPHRIQASLADLLEVFGPERRMVMAREISKTFETFLSGTISSVLAIVEQDPDQQKGEIVLLVAGYQPPEQQEELSPEACRVMSLLLDEKLPVKQAASLAAAITGEKKNRLYDWALTR
ncbi:16S rRNA (cytidine(1402)-2'-O)-methyltransferase [Saccharophagus sp. K07]|jgi:16S rRNA (cytidine1402-2'-O)-methyltransferase|uniref:16S rRNA (cytidine(1402)-2'-O)-methyltransferase n=1 Tax=Saccharophagus sp. K07 TaxID=2283636 RepID=UPI001651F99D|nr:16S rRNA (cytidine(1402)-2'-O)-methyltransferase [Saccharophagus sp. K07]MBC6907322.1 16S rRNA (cytidine(1402)-2'-O)-methyltransferase [Saccharophagus sp. K07]